MPVAELPSDLSASHDLLQALLEISLLGIILFRPVYAADDPATITDLAYVQVNPAAQQMLNLPARPVETLRTLYPPLAENGHFRLLLRHVPVGATGRICCQLCV